MTGSARAVAHSNIALAKYWGKLDSDRNLTAVPSLSLTLAALRSSTRVTFDPELAADDVRLNAAPADARTCERVSALLGRVRTRAGMSEFARVESENDFPTAAGLASSASGFAALALASLSAAGVDATLEEVSALARATSASAARSVFGGYAALERGAESAERVLSGAAFPLEMLVAVTAPGPKSTASTSGMQHTAQTSPYYPAWLEHAPRLYAEVRAAVLARDLDALGPAMEQSALAMHASMLAARPGLIYFVPATLAVIERVRRLRSEGARAYFTIDAGPHVKVLVEPSAASEIRSELEGVAGVSRVLASGPGPDARLVDT